MTTRWLFGDQLGPHFLDDHDGPVVMVESRRVFARRRFHRAKAHLVLSAMRHRAAELGDRVDLRQADTYAEVVGGLSQVDVVHPTSYAALGLVRRLGVEVLDPRGFATSREDFTRWAQGRGGRRLLMEDFYREVRRRHDVLMDGGEPAGGQWNFDHDNREPPPKGATTLGVTQPWWPDEDEIDEQVRADLDRWERDGDVSFIGRDGPRRFAATRAEALAALDHFAEHRLASFGAHEDAVLERDAWMAHSLLSVPLNLGLLDPLEVAARAETAYLAGDVPIASAEGFVRQVIGWRDYVWHLYWYQGEGYRRRNALEATQRLPKWFAELDADATEARCLSHTLDQVAEHGWVHHIPRLMVLGSYAMQRGWAPTQVTDWFHRAFVDGYDWVMVPNVVGLSQHADGGVMATKPYTSGGAYINTMSDHCGSCRFNPRVRVGEDACPFTAGYWWFLDRNRERLAGNQRMARAVQGLDRLSDLEALVAQEEDRGNRAP
ncbi:cryptochrome/photolyase family protein [Knoellia sp. LjRoot47]|uniref:cryptochrome/photolyase family protein n=1 Tax=Knoellia sp. LjRoot47 TaxID=3342330 RepID=UPI003ECD5055